MQYTYAVITLVFLQIADLITTHFILSRGGVELNPVIIATGEYMFLCMVLAKIAFIAILLYVFEKIGLDHPRSTWYACFFVLTLYWVIVGNNMIQIGYWFDLF